VQCCSVGHVLAGNAIATMTSLRHRPKQTCLGGGTHCPSASSCGRPVGRAILFWSCGFFFLSFFLAYSQWSEIGCLPYFHTRCGLSENLECMSEMCCKRLAENTGRKNYAKNRHLHTIAQGAISSQRRHEACTDNRKTTC